MIIVVDASVLVGELLRARGLELMRHIDLEPCVPEEQWDEARYELNRRVQAMVSQGRVNPGRGERFLSEALRVVRDGDVAVVPTDTYRVFERLARRRVPRDERDWPPVALALALDAGILTSDADFLGCGCATWTVETLTAELDAE